MRQTFILTHRWIAIVASIFLLGTAASGAALVFEGAIDRGLHPELWHVNPGAQWLPIDTIVAHVQAHFPGAKIASVSLAAERDRAWTMSAGPLLAFVNPYTGDVIGTRTSAQSQATLARRLHVFHVEFFQGKLGRSFVGVLSGVALFLVVTGMILWWPDKLFRIHTGASWKRINFDLHHAFGIVASLVLVVICASGLVVHYDGLANAIKSLDTIPVAAPPAQPSGTGAPSFDAIAAAAKHALPEAEISFVSLGGGANAASVGMKFPEDHTPAGRTRVFIDRNSDTVLAVNSTRNAQIGTRLDNLKRSLHTGDIFGRASSAIWLVATLTMLSQIVTGVLMWLNARRGRKRAR
ncbi:MAG: PepSY-associated TM helix domain-containing protein [Gemmatimonas sp.]